MAKITGRETVVAFKKATTWRTAVQVGANDGQFITADGLLAGHGFEILRDESLPLAWVQDTDKGLESIAGDITGWLRYQGQELLLALAMGDPQTKAGVGPYTLDIYLATTLRGLFGTYVTLLESTKVAEVPSVKVTGFDLSADFGNPVEVAWHLVGNRLLLTGDTGIVNTTTQTAAVTVANDVKQNRVVLNEDSDFLINAEGGAALSSPTDKLGISGFDFSFNRPVDSFYEVNLTDTGIEEPIGNGYPDPQLTIRLNEFDATNSILYKAQLRDGATYKAKLSFVKTANFGFDLYFPRLRVVEDAPAIGGPGRIENEITFTCLQATAAPTGFNSDLPFYIGTTNNESNDPW